MMPVLQHLSLRNQDAILNLRRTSGQPGCPAPHMIVIDPDSLDNGSHLPLPAVRWMAVGYFADEATSFVEAGDNSSGGYVETTLLVDARWRRRGFGTLLLNATMDWAALRQASGLRLVCPRTDWPMRHFAEKFGARLDLVLGQMVADIPLGQRR
jgi:GNAT superfamily N-acetyltransferase